MKFTIHGRLDGLNDYTLACRRNKFAGNQMKKKNQRIVTEGIRESIGVGNLKPVSEYPVGLTIHWYEKDLRRDGDNVIFGKKFIQDALVASGILVNDTRKHINRWNDVLMVDKENPRIEVEITNGQKDI